MINVSDEFRELMNQRTDFKEQATVTFTDGTELELSADDFSVMNNSYTDGAGASALPLGEAVCRSIELELINDNSQLADYEFYGASIRLYLTFDLSSTTEKIELGTFTVTTPETYGTVVSITAVDDMYKADRNYSTGLTFPATLQSMFLEICDTLGFAYDTAEFNNYSFQVQEQPSSEYTYRQILGYIAQIAGGNARFNRQGYLEILSYDFTADGHSLTEWASLTVATNDITITGIQTTVITTTTSTDEDGNEITEDSTEPVLYGADGYVLSVSNPLISGDEENALALIGSGLVGQSLRIFSGTYIAYPLAEFMDTCTVTDRKGSTYNSVITDVDFTFFGPTLLSNSAESGLKNASTYGGSGTETLIQAKKLVAAETSAREAAVKALQESLSTSSGLYCTTEEQDDGSTIYYLHDKPTLAESANVIKLTAETIGFSTDGGETYPYGFTISGDVIAKLLYAEGINADYITLGSLVVRDDDNNIMLYASPGENRFYINTTNFTLDESGNVVAHSGAIGGWTIDNYRLYAELTALETATETVYVTDADGNYIQETDDDGNPLYYTDDTASETTTEETDYPVYQTEEVEVTTATGYDNYTILNALKSTGDDIAIAIGATDPDDLTTGAAKLYANGNIVTSGNVVIANNKSYHGTDTSGTTRILAAINSSNQTLFGPTALPTYIRGTSINLQSATKISSTLSVSGNITGSGSVIIANGRSFYGTDTSGTMRLLAGINSSDQALLGPTALPTYIRGTSITLQAATTISSTLSVSATSTFGNNLIVANGYALRGKDTSGGNYILAGISGSDEVLFGTSYYPTYIRGSSITCQANMTCTGNGAFSGSLSTYGYTIPRIQHGRTTVSITSASTITEFSVTFSQSFGGVPTVVITPRHNSNVTSIEYKILTASATGFTGYIKSSGTGSHILNWIAMYS